MRLTRNKIIQEIKNQTGLDVGLQKEWNYFWFYSDNIKVASVLSKAQPTSITVFKLNDLSLQEWVQEFKRIYQEGLEA